MGPGLLAALSGNDAGGIATYSSAGASYGYQMLWMLPVMTILLIVTQETAARCGCVTGKGLASLIRERFGVRKSVLAMAALLIANTAVTISEFAGIASGLALFGIPASISVPLVALLIWLLTMSGSFQRIEKILLLVSCVFIAYVVAAQLGRGCLCDGRAFCFERSLVCLARGGNNRYHHRPVDDLSGAEQCC